MLCLFYFEVIFENRTFLPFGYPGEVMGGAPPWGFQGTVRPNPYRLDSGGSAWQLEPWARIVADSYSRGDLPLWNPHQFFGTPLAGDAQPGAFDVLRLPALITDHAWGWDVYYLSQSALCLMLTYIFGRSVGFRAEAAFLTAAAYTFSGFMFIRGNMHYAEIYHLLPGLLWGMERVIRGALRSGLVSMAITIAMITLAGMPEVMLLVFLYAASFGAFRVAWDGLARHSGWFVAHRALLLLAAWVTGIALAAPMLVPLFEYIRQSFSIHPPERGLGLLHLPLRALSYIGVPYINGLPAQPLSPNTLQPVDDYSGAAVVLLALLGLVCLRRLGGSRPGPVVCFALASSVVWGAKLFGVPGITELGRLPLLAQTLIYIFGMPCLSFSIAVLAGAGVQALSSRLVDRRQAALAGLLFLGYLALAARLNWGVLLSVGPRHALATVGLAAAAGTAAWVCTMVGRTWPRTLGAWAVSIVAIGELLILAPHGVYSDRYDSLARPPFVAWLQQQQAAGQPFRVFSNDGLLYPDYAGAFGLDDPRVVDGLWPLRTWDFVKTFVSPTISDRYVGGFGHPELPTQLFANKWLDLSNVRFILRPADRGPADATLAQVIVAAHYPPTDTLHVAEFSVDGQRQEVLVERTPGDVSFSMHPTAAQPTLSFSVGLDPSEPTSRAQFIAAVDGDGQQRELFNRTLDAAAGDRHWVQGSIDLSPYVGRDVTLILRTRTPDGSIASPGWGNLHFTPRPDLGQFRQVYAGEISVWENTRSAPRALLITDVASVISPAEATARMQVPDFDPLRQAVVEDAGTNVAALQGGASATGSGDAAITRYTPERVEVAVQSSAPALLVLTDTYFPDWSAAVDGAPATVMPTDLAFRGVFVPAGSHQVSFTYAPTSFRVGVAMAVAALGFLALLMWRLRGVPRATLLDPRTGAVHQAAVLDPSDQFGLAVTTAWRTARAFPVTHAREIAVAYVGALLAASSTATLVASAFALRISRQLDEGEPLIFGLAGRVLQGQSLYQSIAHQPFVQVHYTPVYYYAVALLRAYSQPSFIPGRALSLIAGLVAAALLGYVTASYARSCWAGLFAGLLFLGLGFPGGPAPFLALERVDVLGTAFSVAAVAVLFGSTDRRHVVAAGILAGLALLTKQSLFAAALAGTLWLATLNVRKAALLAVVVALAVGLPGGWLQWSSGGTFWDNIGPANPSPTALAFGAYLFRELAVIQGVPALVACGYVISARAWRDRSLRLLALYLVASALPVIGILKVGANHNYWIEFAAATSMLSTLAVWHALRARRDRRWAIASLLPIAVLGLALSVMTPLRFIANRSETIVPQSWTLQVALFRELLGGNDTFNQLVDELRGWHGVMLAESMDVAVLSNHPVQFEPFAFSMLEYEHRWNSEPLVADICSGRVDMLVLSYPMESDIHPVGLREFPMWPGSVMAALRHAMQFDEIRGGRWLYHAPASPDAARVASCEAAAAASH